MNLEPLLEEENLLETFTKKALQEMGLDKKLITKLSEDSCQAKGCRGFLGAMVLNFLYRQDILNGKLEDTYVHAYLFAEATGMDLSDLMMVQDFDRPIVVTRDAGAGSDLYINVQDLHLATTESGKDADVNELAKEYHRTGNPIIAKEITARLEEDINKIVKYHYKRLHLLGDWETYLPDAYYALLGALEKWDPEKGASFRTYLFEGVKSKLRRARYLKIREMKRPEYTLIDRPIAKGSDENLSSFMEDKSTPDPLREVLNNELKAIIQQDIQDLPARPRQVLTQYFFEGKTYEEIGELCKGISREMVRQILKPLLAHPRYFKRLRAYVGRDHVITLNLESDTD
ncbi:sigma-70 family RNA polymerase sigma factor [Candidatus Woesearchaeota archaeon]|nr:sigma-70 family RNA polymerase sigma factor [Candidatus Woesearchaeota archaeon]